MASDIELQSRVVMGKSGKSNESTCGLVENSSTSVEDERPRKRGRRAHSRFGVAFQDLGCYGFISSAEHQATFASYVLALPRLFVNKLSGRKPQKVQILHNFDGLVLPGEMLLVLGRPGSGCSTFLKTLAGDTHGFHVQDDSKINYQSIPYREMHREFRGECIYLAELDVHFPELTLGETLSFAATTRETGPHPNAAVRNISYEVASLFRLNEVINAQVGNAMIRGLSGGEKRRTSLAEAFIGDAQLQCWDNSTRGLDSSTALQFIQLLRDSTKTLQSTVVMTIYQASDSMYKTFDKVTLLYEGRQIYFGPGDTSVDYFTRMGFVKPSRATVPDFLTSLTNPEERVIRKGYEDRVPRSPDEFATRWRESIESKTLSAEIEDFNSIHCPYQTTGTGSRTLRLLAGAYALSIYSQISICIQRGFLRLKENAAPGISALIANTILGVVIGSVYYNLDETTNSLDKRSILLFFALMNSAFSPAFEILTMWAQRPIVEKQHRYAFYHPFTEGLASMICDLPFKLTNSFVFHIPLYFLSNLRRTGGAFFTYWLFMFVTVLTMSPIFRTVGSISRTMEQTMAPNSTLVVLAIIYTGFVIPPSYMKPWLGWFRWVNPMAYTYESLMINELNDRNFPCTTTVPSGPGFPPAGSTGAVCSAIGAESGEQSVQGANYLWLKYGYRASHLWRNLPILLAIMIGFCVFHLLATEFIPAQRSKGEILLFPRKFAKRQRRGSIDAEASDRHVFAQDFNTNSLEKLGASGDNRTGNQHLIQMIQEQHAIFHWKGLNYKIKTQDGKLQVLCDIHGWVKPRTLTALMGVTGAGKTSLLDVLADRTSSGIVTGEIHIDGSPRDESFGRRMGYVQQEDVHLPTATVREALQFSALLRQSNKSTEEKLAYVNNVLQLLDMERYADAVVGVPGEGLNVEQRKRLTIAVEMVARPELPLFLDEPTSGVDSQTAWSICTLLRKLADHGQTILCTIHQPSSELFEMFDSLLLVNKGGTELYFGPLGPDASTVVEYFESQGAPKCPPGANPAEWVIEVTQPSREAQKEGQPSWPDKWNNSEQKKAVIEHLEALAEISKHSSAIQTHKRGEFAVPTLQQLIVVMKRTFQDYWRDPKYLYSKLALCIGISLVNGISFYNSPLDIQGLTNTLFSIFLVTQLFSTIGQQVIPRLADGRALFEARERRNKSYSWVVFVASNVLIELFWQTLASVLVFAIWYYPTGTFRNGDAEFGRAERGGLTFILVWLFCLWTSTLSQALAAGIEHPETAVQISTLFFWLSLVFCGILVAPDALPGFWIFMYRVSPLTYLMNGLVSAGLSNTKITCSWTEILTINNLPNGFATCGEYLDAYARVSNGQVLNPDDSRNCRYCPVSDVNTFLRTIGMGTENRWNYMGYMFIYVIFNVLATFGIYWLARTPRTARKDV
ncbi:Multidrug resistance protein [Parahypoxylon ruwenzoriense]